MSELALVEEPKKEPLQSIGKQAEFEKKVLEYLELQDLLKQMNARKKILKEDILDEMSRVKQDEYCMTDGEGKLVTVDREVKFSKQVNKKKLAAKMGIAVKELTPENLIKYMHSGQLTLEEYEKFKEQVETDGLKVKRRKRQRLKKNHN